MDIIKNLKTSNIHLIPIDLTDAINKK